MSAVDPAGFAPDPAPIHDPEAARRARLLAIGLMCVAFVLFALLDTTAKYLIQQSYDPMQIAWCRYAFHALIAFVIINPLTRKGAWHTRHPVLQAVRSLLLASSTLLNFWALQSLRLDQIMTIMFVTPLLVAILSGPFLGEWVGPRRLVAIMVGFLGVLLVTRPGLESWQPAYALALTNAAVYAVYNILTRLVSRDDSASTSFFYVPILGTLALIPFLPDAWIWPQHAADWGFLAATGLLGGIGHFMLILAHGLAPAGVLAPFMYTQLAWMILMGWIVFHDVPDIWTLSGAAIVIGCGLYLFARERSVKHIG